MTALLISLLIIGVRSSTKPNIIIIYPDNQDLLLGSTAREFMPILNSHIIDNGITIKNAFVSTPICCPSRAELLTGRYYHNIGPPFPPNGTCMHIDPYHPVFDNNTLFQVMHNNGYHTGAFGKIMNDMNYWCDTNSIPHVSGLSRLYIPCNYLDYYGHVYFNKFENGSYIYSFTNTSFESPQLYQTAQIGNATIDWIKDMHQDGKEEPFFALWGVHAPHYPAVPAAWYRDRFNTSKAPRTPNFNQHYSGKHWLVDRQPELDETAISFIDQLWRNRLRAMLSVDDFIHDLDVLLEDLGIKNNTFIFYVSDNGMHLGQWRLSNSFKNIYETDIRVPFFVRGPNIKAKSNMNEMVSNIDIAPTIYELAGIKEDEVKLSVDGKSFAKYLVGDTDHDGDKWRDKLLFEYIWVANWTFANYPVWFPTNVSYIGTNTNPPCCNNATHEPYWVDNSYMSSFRSLRIMNDTFNITYAEYITGSYTQNDFDDPLWFEMYNLTNDPYQTRNIYNETDEEVQIYLHRTLMDYGACKTTECP